MVHSRTINSVRNIIWAVIQKVILMLLPFVVRTVMLYRLGAEYTGLGSLFNSVLNMLSLAELGFSSAMVYCMYEPINNGDEQTICALLNLYKKTYGIIGGIILIIGLLLLPFLPNLISNEIPVGINIYILYIIYLSNTVISYFMFAYKSSLITAYQRNDIISIASLGCSACLYGFQIIALIITKSFYVYAILFPFSTLLLNLSYEVISRKLYPNIKCHGYVEVHLKEKIKKRVMGIMLYKFASTTRTSFDSIIISSFLGLTVLTKYQNYFMIISAATGILSMVNTAVTASVGNSIVSKSVNENYKDFRKFVFMYMWVAGGCAICIVCLIQPFMKLWMGEKLMLSGTMAVLFSVYFYVQTMGDTVFLYRTAAGLWWQDRVRPIVEAIVNIVLNVLLVKVCGLFGVILATIITLIGINFLWGALILFKSYFKENLREYISIQGTQAIMTIITAGVVLFVCNLIGGTGILNLFLRGIACIVVPNILYLIFYMKNSLFMEAKQFTSDIIRMLLKRKLGG